MSVESDKAFYDWVYKHEKGASQTGHTSRMNRYKEAWSACLNWVTGASLDKELEQMKIDAERWNALVNCGRIRVLGTARLGQDNQHIGMEVWEQYPNTNPETSEFSKRALFTFVDTIRNRK